MPSFFKKIFNQNKSNDASLPYANSRPHDSRSLYSYQEFPVHSMSRIRGRPPNEHEVPHRRRDDIERGDRASRSTIRRSQSQAVLPTNGNMLGLYLYGENEDTGDPGQVSTRSRAHPTSQRLPTQSYRPMTPPPLSPNERHYNFDEVHKASVEWRKKDKGKAKALDAQSQFVESRSRYGDYGNDFYDRVYHPRYEDNYGVAAATRNDVAESSKAGSARMTRRPRYDSYSERRPYHDQNYAGDFSQRDPSASIGHGAPSRHDEIVRALQVAKTMKARRR